MFYLSQGSQIGKFKGVIAACALTSKHISSHSELISFAHNPTCWLESQEGLTHPISGQGFDSEYTFSTQTIDAKKTTAKSTKIWLMGDEQGTCPVSSMGIRNFIHIDCQQNGGNYNSNNNGNDSKLNWTGSIVSTNL